jgi:hypothetical protein
MLVAPSVSLLFPALAPNGCISNGLKGKLEFYFIFVFAININFF